MPKRKSKKVLEKERLAKKAETIRKRQQKEKKKLLEEFEHNYNISAVCARAKIHRSKFYRWYDEDSTFKKAVDKAREKGQSFVSDGVEARLLNLAKEGNMPAVKFFLQHNSPKYMSRKVPEDDNKYKDLEDIHKAKIAKSVIAFSGLDEKKLIEEFEKERKNGLDLVGT